MKIRFAPVATMRCALLLESIFFNQPERRGHMKLVRTTLAVSLFAAFAGQAALAAEEGWYVYGSAGSTSNKGAKEQTDTAITNAGETTFTSSAKDADTGYKLQLGYRFTPNLAVEGGYVDLGSYTYHASGTAPVVGTRDGIAKHDGWTLATVGRLPITSSLAAFGKLGAVRYQTDLACSGTGLPC
jgi:OOP family OmpA-OmpF porin